MWQLDLPLDPLGGLPFRIVKAQDDGGDATSQTKWWRFVQQSLGRRVSLLDSINMRRTTEEEEEEEQEEEHDQGNAPPQFGKLAKRIMGIHRRKEAQAKKEGKTPPERRDMVPVSIRRNKVFENPYLALMEATLRRAHVWHDHEVTGATMLLSCPGCRKQKWHRDYATHRYRRRCCPYACLLVLDNPTPTKLHVFNASCVYGQSPCEQVVYVEQRLVGW